MTKTDASCSGNRINDLKITFPIVPTKSLKFKSAMNPLNICKQQMGKNNSL